MKELGLRVLDWCAREAPEYTACYLKEARSQRISGFVVIKLAHSTIGDMFSRLTTDPRDRSLIGGIIKPILMTACMAYADSCGASYFSSSGRAHLYRAVVLGVYEKYVDLTIPKIRAMIFNENKEEVGTKRGEMLKSVKWEKEEEKYKALHASKPYIYILKHSLITVFLNRIFLPYALSKYLPNLSSPIWTAALCHPVRFLVCKLLLKPPS
ncbi:MAG: hypothetical protein LVR00_06740 [Rhabdochlamydiaceae bacterium]